MAAILRAVEALGEVMGAPVAPVERSDHAHALADARDQRNSSNFSRALEQGRAMALEDWMKVVDFALGE